MAAGIPSPDELHRWHEVVEMNRTRTSILIAGLATLLVLPGPTDASDPERTRPTALEGSSIAWCGEVESIRADPALYGDRPVYVFNDPHMRKVLPWARTKPGFEEAWLDRENFGWITLGFTEGVKQRQAELEREFPGVGVVAVEVEHTKRERDQLQDRLADILFDDLGLAGAVGSGSSTGMVHVDVVVTEEVVAALETEFGGEPFCLDGPDPSELPPPGPQATEGDGWMLVGLRRDGPPYYRTGIATGQVQLGELWAKAEMPGDAPVVDFAEHVVLWFAVPHGSSCLEHRLDDVVVDVDRSIIHPVIVQPDLAGCTDDLAGAYHFLVALERDRLPSAPIRIQLRPEDPPPGIWKERTVVDVDLTSPGSIAREADIHFDRTLRRWTHRTGTTIEPRDRVRYALDTTCGVGYLGEVNDIHWVTAETGVPAAWASKADERGEIVVGLRLRGGSDPHVTATANGHRIRYGPVREAPAACEAASKSALEEAALPEAPQAYLSDGTTIPDVERSTEALATIADREEYGGAFLHTDPERRYMLAVMWTGDIEALASELQTLLGEDAAFEIRAVEYSDAELMAVSDAISDLTPELNERGVLVVSISRDAEANRVDVGIEGPLEVAEELLAPFGEVVRVLQEDVPTLD